VTFIAIATPWISSAAITIAVRRAYDGEEVSMGLYVGSTVINTVDMETAIAFWTAALGYVVRGSDPTFAVLTDPRRRWSNLSLQHTDEPKRSLNRLHLDLYSSDREGEVARLEGLGATRVPWQYREGHDHIVMADPDGNEFCVIQSPYTQD
jgi:catechol 2,3-dioxygenase-like lactoylglutathione lyase family enzyme